MKLGILFIIFILCGCYKLPILTISIEPQFQEYVSQFESLYGIKIDGSIVSTEKVPFDSAHVVAVCQNYGRNSRWNVVYVQRKFWDKADFHTRQEMLFHELGHCVMGLKDDLTITQMGGIPNVPRSIMYPWLFGDTLVYRENLEYYLKELGERYE